MILEQAGGVFDTGPDGYAQIGGGHAAAGAPVLRHADWSTAHPALAVAQPEAGDSRFGRVVMADAPSAVRHLPTHRPGVMRRDQGGRARWRYRGTLGRPRARRARLRGRRRREDGHARGQGRSSPVRPVGPAPWGPEPRYERRHPEDPVSWVPGEHGFRFFPGFYRHVVDTMERIPSTEGVSAADHLVPTARCALSQYDRPTFSVPVRFPRSPGDVGAVLGAVLAGFGPVAELTPNDLAHFGARIWQLLTSCQRAAAR